MNRDCVLIVGSGLMGSGIAAISALAGNKTILVDTTIQKAETGIANAINNIHELVANDLTNKEAASHGKDLLIPSENLDESLQQAKMVIEAIYENLQAKQELFEKMDRQLPVEVPILSNTSGLRITDIAARVKHPGRTVTTHFWFPAHLVPLVEVVMGDQTDEVVAVAVKETLAKWGKAPVLVRKDLPGQLANRILQAVIREAVNIVATGLASPEDVDTAVKMGMGIRFPAWGPLEHIDAVGLDLAVAVQDSVLPEISSATETNRYLTELVNNGDLGYKTGKGIYDWSQKDMAQLARGRNEFIIHALKKIRK